MCLNLTQWLIGFLIASNFFGMSGSTVLGCQFFAFIKKSNLTKNYIYLSGNMKIKYLIYYNLKSIKIDKSYPNLTNDQFQVEPTRLIYVKICKTGLYICLCFVHACLYIHTQYVQTHTYIQTYKHTHTYTETNTPRLP